MSNHTPGPWAPVRTTAQRLFVVPDGSGFRCAIVGNGVDVAIVHGRTKRECAANASLVAAAPATRPTRPARRGATGWRCSSQSTARSIATLRYRPTASSPSGPRWRPFAAARTPPT